MKPSATKGRRRPAAGSRRGIAVVLALVLVVILSVTAAAALGMVGGERHAIEDQQAAAEAHAMARSAYDQFLTNPSVHLPAFTPETFAGPDSVRFVLNRGYAWVSVQRVRPSVTGSAPLFLVRSRAVRTLKRSGRAPVAERVFAQYTRWNGSLPAVAGWTSLSGLLKNGGSGMLDGADNCGAAKPVAGVAVPTVPGYIQNGGSSVPTGSPGVLDMGSQTNANAMVGINWISILEGMAASADIVYPGGSWPSFSNTNYWPVIYVDQVSSFSLPGSGRGMLVVKNDLVINDLTQWDGIILVGGTLTSNGNNTVNGGMITGLNMLLGQIVLPSSVGNGTKIIRYDSCNVDKASQRFKGLVALRNTGADNWGSY